MTPQLTSNESVARQQSTEALSASEVKYRRLFEAAQDGILILDAVTGVVVDVNPFLVKLLGFTREQFLGKKIWELGFFKDIVANQTHFAELQQKEYIRYEDMALETAAGRRIEVEFVSNVYLVNGQRVIQCNIRDNTARHRTEFQLRLRTAALEAAANAIVITDRAGTIAWTNPAFTRLTGYPVAEVLGQNLRLLKSGKQDAAFYENLWATITAGQVWHGEIINRRKDGSLYTEEMTIAPVSDEKGKITHFIDIKQDITARKQAEEKIYQFNAELEQRVQKRTAELQAANAELDAFTYSVSHDLRAPLRAIDGFSQALLEDCGAQLSADGRHELESIREGAQNMAALISDLLTLSKLSRQALKKQTVETDQLVRRVFATLDRQDRRVEFRCEPLPVCAGDPVLLKQVWLNLLSNALKYTRLRQVALIEVGCRMENGEAVFWVRDNGTGFDMQYVHKLFGVFQRLHRPEEYEGTGVGLAIVQRIIQRHGGRVWAEAVPERGATFFFTLEGATKL